MGNIEEKSVSHGVWNMELQFLGKLNKHHILCTKYPINSEKI